MTPSRSEILVVTTDRVATREIAEVLGLVRGSTVRAKHIGSDIVASLRNLVGGEVREYAQLLAAAREQALDRILEDARRLGADAVVGARMQTSTIGQQASEVVFYGTAVRLVPC
ncbi:YbjQ family protein [Oceaniglobus roseus]|uniref:YbjQ family protein n=1 Tax=Oceaniglobus roseus TaxID=1737570 RepID=UPI001FE251F6|nr:YbjQ family protein [Kandeliimicrobium roseum]